MSLRSKPKPRKKAKPKKPSRTRLRNRADVLWSHYIKQRDGGQCQACGSFDWPQAAHLITRSYGMTRWMPTNGVTLCRSCHVRYTHRPLEWSDWCDAKFGPERLVKLKLRALAVDTRPDVEAAVKALELLLAADA